MLEKLTVKLSIEPDGIHYQCLVMPEAWRGRVAYTAKNGFSVASNNLPVVAREGITLWGNDASMDGREDLISTSLIPKLLQRAYIQLVREALAEFCANKAAHPKAVVVEEDQDTFTFEIA